MITMELWTILWWWCICHMLVLLSYSTVEATVSRYSKKTTGENRYRGNLHQTIHQSPDTVAYDDDEGCEEMQSEQLAKMLGGAYNTRYMSIGAPENRKASANSKKRGAEDDLLFAVDDTYSQQISDTPAWEMNFATYATSDVGGDYDDGNEETGHRDRRSVTQEDHQETEIDDVNRELRSAGGNSARDNGDSKRSWDCGMVIKWKDLGKDYFPRHIRTVECTKTQCFYGQFTCQPRSFTVQLLRRKGRCVRPGRGHRNSTTPHPHYKTGVEGLPKELRELWVWEERAVNFCCECSAPTHSGHRRFYS